MVAEVDMRTTDVFTVKVTLLLPAGTVTLEGTLAATLLLESVTCAPPAGAGPLSVTVPVDDCIPPVTLVGFNVIEETATGGADITGSVIDGPLLTCTWEMGRSEERRVAQVRSVWGAVVLADGTVTLEGTLAAALLLESVTCAPPAGASPLSVTVPVDDCFPPVTLVWFNLSEETATGGADITGSVIVWPLLTCTWEMC